MITPFTADGEVDYEGAVTLAKHLVEHGSEGILVGGTTGEGATMTADEKLKLYAAVVNAVGRNASGKKVPVMGNLPGRTGVSILPETIKRIVDECPNVVGIKDAAGNWDQVTKEKTLLPDDFMIYSGDDSFTLPILAGGGVGVISVASHVIGDDLLAMVKAFEEGRLQDALQLHIKMYPIMKGMFFIASPIPVKTAVNLIGLPGGHFRLPIAEPSDSEREHVREMLNDYGISC